MKILVKAAVWLWDKTFRRLLNWIFNIKWNIKIKNSKELQQKIEDMEYQIEQTTKPSQLKDIFRKLFPNYKPDPLGGALDNQSSWTTLIAKMDENIKNNRDCDDMSEAWYHLAPKYCSLLNFAIEKIGIYSWGYSRKLHKSVKMFHVMTMAEVMSGNKKKYILFDYNNIIQSDNIEKLYDYYIESYLIKHRDSKFTEEQKKKLSNKNMFNVELTEPKSVNL